MDAYEADALSIVRAEIIETEWEYPGRLSSHLANRSGPYLNDPFGWRAVIDRAMEAGSIEKKDGRLTVVSQEDAEARAAALAHVDNHQPMALEAQNPPSPPAPKIPSTQIPESPPAPENPAICGCGAPLTGGTKVCVMCALASAGQPKVDIYSVDIYAKGYTDRVAAVAAEQAKDWPKVEAEPQPQPPVKRKRRTKEEIEADKAAKLLAKEEAKAERIAERERLKLDRAHERVQAKIDAKNAKILECEGGRVQLPAMVFRDGTVKHATDVEAWQVIELYLDHLFLDCENSGYPLGHQLYELRTIQLGGEEVAVVFDARDAAQLQIVALALALAKKISAHSAAADAIPCVVAGLVTWDDIWAKMHDSVLYLKLIDPKLSGSDASKLKEVAGDLLFEYAVSPQAERDKNALFKAMGCLTDTDVTTPPDRSGWYSVNPNSVVMCRYAGSDVLDLAAVMRVLPDLPVSDNVLERERWFEAKCARVGLDGFKLNKPHIKGLIEFHESAKNQAQADVAVLSDNRILNPSSPDVAKQLMELFPGIELGVSKKTGDPSAAKKELEKVCRTAKDSDELLFHLCKQILAYRHHVTTLGLLLRPLETLCDYGDSRMRPTVYTINADTGRTSCVRPNGQQFSRQGGVRASVEADEGYYGVDADFQGCEIKVAAGLSGDRALLEAEIKPWCLKCQRESTMESPCSCGIEEGELKSHTGLHWLAAHEAFGPGATKEHRYWCKRGIFCKLFGGGAETAAAQVYCDLKPMEKIFSAFEELAPVYTAWDKWLRSCYYEGMQVWRDYEKGENFSQKLDGKRRGIYRTYSGRNIYINAPHAFGNYAIQGTARELLVDGIIRWSSSPWGSLPLLPIHDEILTWVPQAEAHQAREHLVKCMETNVLSSPGFPITIGADPSPFFTSWPDSS